MIFGSESISHYSKGNIALWMALAFQAGTLNIGGFMACHRFVSHVTGFATFFGYEAAQPGGGQALGMLAVPLFFLLGGAISGLLVDLRLGLKRKPKYYIAFGLMFAIIFSVWVGGVSGFFGLFGEPLNLTRDYILLILLCLVCGIQNGVISTVSKSKIRTTHLTGITTDLGIELVRAFSRKNLPPDPDSELRANLVRMGIIIFFILGSVVGGFSFSKFQYMGFLVPTLSSGVMFSMMFYFQVLRAAR